MSTPPEIAVRRHLHVKHNNKIIQVFLSVDGEAS